MKLAAKITALLLAGILVLIVAADLVTLRYEQERLLQEQRVEAVRLAQAISAVTNRLWIMGGREPAVEAIQRISGLSERTSIRIVYFDVQHPHRDAPRVAASWAGDVYSQRCRDESGQYQLYTLARFDADNRPAAIELAEPLQTPNLMSGYYVWHAALLIGSTTLLGAVMVLVIGSHWIGRPLRRLIEKTRRIGAGDLSEPLELDRKDEFGELADAINSMCDQLRQAQGQIAEETRARVAALEQLRHADRLRTVGRLASGIAHELGTPLNVVSGRAGLIASGRLSADDVHQSAWTIKSEAERIAGIIRQLLDFARRNTPQRKLVDLNELAHQTLELIRPIAEKRQCAVAFTPQAPPPKLQIDPAQIQQVLTNLVVNAAESMPQGGAVEVTITQQAGTPPRGTDGPRGRYARIDVRDHGEGMTPDVLDQIFEPFFTTKRVGEGTGLGLSIAYGIVQEHGGWIDVASQPGQGSCFTVFLPTEVTGCKVES